MIAFYLCAAFMLLLLARLYVPGLYRAGFKRFMKHLGPVELERYRIIDVRKNPVENCQAEYRKRLSLMLILNMTGLVLGLYILFTSEGGKQVDYLLRPSFGEGDREENLTADLDGELHRVKIILSEKEPDKEEADRFFAAVSEAVRKKLSADNEDLSHVTESLDLPYSLEGVDLSWVSPRPELISSLGVIGQDIPKEGITVSLGLTMTYRDHKRSCEIPVTLFPPQNEGEGDKLSDYLSSIGKKDPDSYEISLPKEYDQKKLVLRRNEDNSGQSLALLVLAASLLIWMSEGSRLEDNMKKRNKELEEDYPDIVSRLSIFFSAGLSIPAAFLRLSEDYEKELLTGGKRRSGFEEIRLSALELRNTGYSGDIFHSFGVRCGSYRYMRLADVFEQSMKKGTLQLTLLLEQEALAAFELKKLQAAKAGEEAGAKLLLPMMIMFALVIAMVVVPAWSQMRL